MTLKIAAFAPIPSASVTIAISANPGRRASARNAVLISFMLEMVRATARLLRGGV